MTATALAAACLAVPAHALEPLPACYDVKESGMTIAIPDILGHDRSGIIIEGYDDMGYAGDPSPPESLKGFRGVRIMDCRSGRFLTVDADYDDMRAGLPKTEFLRADVQAGKPLSFDKVKQAVAAVYPGKARQFRETEESCSCSVYFPKLRPAKLTPFSGSHTQ